MLVAFAMTPLLFAACGVSVVDSSSSSSTADAGAGPTTSDGSLVGSGGDAQGGNSDGGDGSVDATTFDDAMPEADAGSGCSSYEFTATATTFVEVPYSTEFDIQNPFTIEAWVYAKGDPSQTDIVSHRDDNNNLGWALDVYNSRQAEFRLYGGPGPAPDQFVATGGSVPSNTWTHLAGSWDGTTMRSFVNGALVDTSSFVGPIASFPNIMRIGMSSYNNGHYFDGLIDEIRITKAGLYTVSFNAPKPPMSKGPATIALYRFTTNANETAVDETGQHHGRLGLAGVGDSQEPKRVNACVPP